MVKRRGGKQVYINSHVEDKLILRLSHSSQRNNQPDHMDHSLVQLNETMSHVMYGHPRQTCQGGEL